MAEEVIKFAKQVTPEHKYVVAFDTICDGQDCWKGEENDKPVIALYTKEEAEAEIQDSHDIEKESCKASMESMGEGNCDVGEVGVCSCEGDSYIVPMDEYIHNRKTIFGGEGISIVGIKPQ